MVQYNAMPLSICVKSQTILYSMICQMSVLYFTSACSVSAACTCFNSAKTSVNDLSTECICSCCWTLPSLNLKENHKQVNYDYLSTLTKPLLFISCDVFMSPPVTFGSCKEVFCDCYVIEIPLLQLITK